MTEPNEITVWMHVSGRGQVKCEKCGSLYKDAINGLVFCEEVITAISRDPNRRAEIERHKTKPWCRVVDYSEPIKVAGYRRKMDHGNIIGWKPMEGH